MAKPKLCLIPAAQGDKFYSVLPSSGVGDFDFSRSGGATRINSQGLIETVASGVSRLNYPLIDGKVVGCPSHLLEPQSLNSQTNSEDLTVASSYPLGAVSISSNQAISPNGTLNADKLVESNTNARHELYSKSLSFSGTTSVSFFAKAAERRYISVFVGGDPDVGGATFDVEEGIVSLTRGGTNASIIKYSNGWYRCELTSTKVANSQVYYCLRDNGNAVDVQTYQGDGISGMYLWGFQTEIGQSYPTSYIPTTNSATTRSAETATNSGDASTFNSSEGVLMAEISALDNDGTFRFISLKNNTTVDIIRIGYITTPNRIEIQNYKSGALFNSFNYEVQDLKTNTKVAFKWKDNDFQLYINGLNVSSNTSVTAWGSEVFQSLQFNQHNGGNNFYGNTKQIQYFDSALNDSDLEKLTSWVSFTDMAEGQLYSIE